MLGNSGDTREVDAAYVSGTGTKALVFGYTVVSTDEDNNGIYLRDEQDYDSPDGPVRLDSNDEIEFKDTSTDVPLYWQGRGNHSDHKVDGSRTTGNTAPSFTSSPTFDVRRTRRWWARWWRRTPMRTTASRATRSRAGRTRRSSP